MTRLARSVRAALPGFSISALALIWGVFLRNPAGVVLGALGVAAACVAFVWGWRTTNSASEDRTSEVSGRAGPVVAKVRVPGHPMAIGGWKGLLEVDGEVLRVAGVDGHARLDIDCREIKRYSFNPKNGLWAFRMRDGNKLYLQMSGGILSADRSPAGREATRYVSLLVAAHGRRSLRI